MLRSIIIAGSFFAACGGRTELGVARVTDAAASSEASPTTDTAILVAECGPTDGPAFAIVIAPSATCAAPYAAIDLGTTLHFYGSPLPEAIGSYAISDGSPTAGSGATACDSSGCNEATSGTLVITDEKSFECCITQVSGSFSLTLTDGTTRTGTFVAQACHNNAQCG